MGTTNIDLPSKRTSLQLSPFFKKVWVNNQGKITGFIVEENSKENKLIGKESYKCYNNDNPSVFDKIDNTFLDMFPSLETYEEKNLWFSVVRNNNSKTQDLLNELVDVSQFGEVSLSINFGIVMFIGDDNQYKDYLTIPLLKECFMFTTMSIYWNTDFTKLQVAQLY